MKTFGSTFFRLMYWVFVIGFTIQLAAVGQTLYYMFVAEHNQQSGVTAYADIRIFGDDALGKVASVNKDPEVDVNIFQLHLGRSAIFFADGEQIGWMGYLNIILNVLHYAVWLWFTWLLLSVFKSINTHQIFEVKNIRKLRFVALIVGIDPLIILLRNWFYIPLVNAHVTLENIRVVYSYDFSLFSGFLYMLLILLVIEVLKYGISIKQENDLTI